MVALSLHISAHEHDVARAQFCLNHGEDVNVTYRNSCHNHLAKIVLNITDTSTHLSYQQSALMEAFDGAVERNKFDTLPAIVEFLCRRGAKSSRKWCANFEQQCKRDRISNTDLEKSINIIVKALEDRCVARKTAN